MNQEIQNLYNDTDIATFIKAEEYNSFYVSNLDI